MDMNKLTLLIMDAKEKIKHLSEEVRFKSLMYAFMVVKGNPELLKLGDNVADIFSMLYDIDPGLGRTIFTENKEYAVLRITLGMSAETITQELTKFSSELLRFTEACKEVE